MRRESSVIPGPDFDSIKSHTAFPLHSGFDKLTPSLNMCMWTVVTTSLPE